MEAAWIADTEPNERFTLYSRGNVGEVFPNVLTPLTATLIGDAASRGQAAFMSEFGVLRPEEMQGESVGTGVFGGYLYMNASAMRLFGVRMLGMSAADADAQVMGDMVGAPAYEPQPGDRNLRATLSLAKSTVAMLRKPDISWLDVARRDAIDWLATLPALQSATDDELVAWVRTYPHRLATSLARLLRASGLAAVPRGIIDQMVERKGGDGLANRIVGGTGDVDSAKPALGIWVLSRRVAADPALMTIFDSRANSELAGALEGSSLEGPLRDFLAEFGHRGPDEYELATPSWAMDPAPALAAVERLRLVPDDRDPRVTGERLRADSDDALAEAASRLPRPARRLLRHLALIARQGSIARERAKDVLVLENLGARRALDELMRRAAARGGPVDRRACFSVTIDELTEFVADPASFSVIIDDRMQRQLYLMDRVPPPWFVGRIPSADTWSLREGAKAASPIAGDVLRGIAVSGGVASGPARVIVDPGDPRGLEAGEVLVCSVTDPSWTPLFLVAAAVVCDTGAMQSHAAIVARELGIPGVLSVPGITAVADGTMLHVDGSTGTVRVG
jgi:rifampicin phosphotransferase